MSFLSPAISFRALVTIILVGAGLRLAAQDAPEPYLNPSLPAADRVRDLISRMTLEEEVAQLQNEAPAIPRLHVPSYDWWNEGLHGVARSGYATVFPQAIGLAATWDMRLVKEVADTISTEARAKYNHAQRHGNHSIYYGLTLWSPNINIDRDPRWGRGQETYGEDPFLTGQIGAAFVQGLQGSDPNYLKTIATPKHFAVHSGPESERHTFDAVVSPHDLADTYLPAFRKLVVDSNAASVMCAYNSLDGAPACANSKLLKNTLRGDWHFDGYVVSDCGAIFDITVGHRFSPDQAHAAAAALLAGTDLSCGREFASLVDAVHQGLVAKADVDAAVTRLFLARFRLGIFDPPERIPWSRIPFSENDSQAHAALSLQAARASMVLLRNEHNTLPIAGGIHSIAVIGPNAAALAALEGNYNAVASHPVTPLAALEEKFPGHIHYAQGSPYVEGLPVPVPGNLFSTQENGNRVSGLTAEYFGGPGVSGTPAATRVDRAIDFDWNGSAPVPGVSSERFAVRWSGLIAAPIPGRFAFGFSMAHCSTCDDSEAIRVWLDEKLVYDFVHHVTHGRRAPTPRFELEFADANPHRLRIEYLHDAPHFGAGLVFNWIPPVSALREQAVQLAAQSDLAIAFVGLSPDLEGEEMPIHVDGFQGGDRATIELPGVQKELIAALAATGKPLVLVLMNGSALALGDSVEKAGAILEAWYPGANGGTAIADTLLGENNPAGRLPVTFYASTSQLPAFTDYSMKERTYRYFSGAPEFPFGFGLSYSSFQYSAAKLSNSRLQAGEGLRVQVTVTNRGDRDGDEVVQVYLAPKSIPASPIRTLVGFERIHLAAGASRELDLAIDSRQLSIVSPAGERRIMPGEYELAIGGGQPQASDGIALKFQIVGTASLAP
jgi:beta-glucosidase